MSLNSWPVTGAESAPSFDLLASGVAAYDRILRRIAQAKRSVMLRCFEWRDDDTGQSLARALLTAADRGVAVTIYKDRVGRHYEHLEATKQSFFHKKIDLPARLQTWALMTFYGRWGSLRQNPSPLADALVAHPNVKFVDNKRFDHAKLYVFDDEVVILGGMGIGDDFRDTNVDFMVEISGGGAATRLADRYEGRAPFDPARSYDYLLHTLRSQDRKGLAAERFELIAGARQRLTIEMAYLGDPASTDRLVAAVKRGVKVTMLTAARSNVGADLNLFTCAELLRRTGSPENLRIVLHPRMVHGKAIVGDGEWVDLGSANFTRLSHGDYEEVDLFCRDRAFAKRVEQAIEEDARAGAPARLPLAYSRTYVAAERAVSAFHARKKRG
ncbi:MAG TPA: phosphatidylserine/phosphatidylglycerophosphate/cardiolipin synthase family protein [Polyangia bacterium]